NFLSFTAQAANGNVGLDWVVESQTATGYIVERSFDGNNFDPLSTLSPQAGNNPTNSFTYIDNNATSPTGTLYYRIKEEDVSGQEYYSSIVALKTSSPAATAGIYPNPARESFTLTFTSTIPGPINLRMFDLGGRLVLNRSFQASTGMNAVTVDGLGSLTEGMYLLQWSDGSNAWTSKVIIRR
ncbi:MAG TPA: T9SS type A sorting domain-containing protein, partial [Puia sp.]|nr:T9SS type A sorting domain-containing protein [Puia sp.]